MVRIGWWYVLPLLFLFLLLLFLAQRTGSWAWTVAAVVAGVLVWFCANFFRDPVRRLPADPAALVAPADGKVLEVKRGSDPFVGDCWEVHIFLNVFDVHSQRSPFTGPCKVERLQYNKGKFMAAYAPKASLENEQNWIFLRSAKGQPVVVKQIAGLVARRILCWVKEGDEVQGGQKIGFIRFGSQVDLIFPVSAQLQTQVGQVVVGGETILARF
jgi:phosphatidylserine decarboxylase